MSLIHTNPLLNAGYGREYLPEAVFPVWGKLQHHVDGFYYPSQENLLGGTGAFPCLHIFQGQDFLSVSRVYKFMWSEHLFQCMEQGASNMVPPMGGPLGYTQKNVEKDVLVGCGFCIGAT